MLQFLGGMPRYVVETALMLGRRRLRRCAACSPETSRPASATLGIFLAGAVRVMGLLLPLQTAVAALKVNAERSRMALDLLGELDGEPVDAVPAAVVALQPGPLEVALTDAAFRYPGDEADTIHDVDLTIEPGAFAAVIGPSGARQDDAGRHDARAGVPALRASVRVGGADPRSLGAQTLEPSPTSRRSPAWSPARSRTTSRSASNRSWSIASGSSRWSRLPSCQSSSHPPLGRGDLGRQAGRRASQGADPAHRARPCAVLPVRGCSSSTRRPAGSTPARRPRSGAPLRLLHGDVTVLVIAHRLSTVQHADIVHVIEQGG